VRVMVVVAMMVMVWLGERRPRDEQNHREQQNLFHGPDHSNIRSNLGVASLTLLGDGCSALNQSRYGRLSIPLIGAPRLWRVRKKKTSVTSR
jgi:hypothetical protein